jgi:TetR/AcrR family fatty acid metabolism transcriptional regulator
LVRRLPRRRDEARPLLRSAILAAAETVFAERGFHGARIQDIATKAGIAAGTVYNHFAHKDDVLVAILEEHSRELLEQLEARPDDPEDFAALLEARVGRLLAYVQRHRAFFAIAYEQGLFAGGAAPGARVSARPLAKVESFRSLFLGLVEQGIKAGALEPLEAEILARFLGGTMRAFVLSSLTDGRGDASAQEHAALTVDLFLHGAARRERATPGGRR